MEFHVNVIKKLWALAWVAAFLAVLFSASAMALPTDFSKLYVFGDSLSDTGNDLLLSNGNIPPTTRYDNGRFSNGTVWVEMVADAFGINPSHFVPSLSPNATPANFLAGYSLNYAYGGSATGLQNISPDGLLTVRGLLGQVADFTSFATAAGGVSDPAHSLYTLWSGANDYLMAGSGGIPAPPDPVAIVGNVRSSIQQLYNLGARNFLVPTLPDLGDIPIVALGGDSARASASFISLTHNNLLKSTLQDLLAIDPGIRIYAPDIFSLFEAIFADPAAFGFTHATTELGPASGCLILPPHVCTALPTGFDGLGYPIWDEEHPTQKMHALIAQTALAAEAIPEPSSVVLFLVGGLPLAVRGRALVKRIGRKPAG
jgi:phospholipase/lecithinase/hemolysin